MADRYLHGSTQLDSISADGSTSTSISTILTGVTKGGTSLQPGDIVNNVASTASNKVLAAAQGKVLNDKIAAIESRGRFLSIWDASLGQPNDLPGGGSSTTAVYTYKTGDYFIVKAAGNKVPSGTSIPSGTTIATFPSTTGDSSDINDSIYFNGTSWAVLHTPYGTGDVTGPASATDKAIVRFDGTTGKLIQNSAVTIDNSGIISASAGIIINRKWHLYNDSGYFTVMDIDNSKGYYFGPTNLRPTVTANTDLGSSNFKFKDAYLSGTINLTNTSIISFGAGKAGIGYSANTLAANTVGIMNNENTSVLPAFIMTAYGVQVYNIRPVTTNNVNLGTSSYTFKDIYSSGLLKNTAGLETQTTGGATAIGLKLWKGTQAQYDTIATPDANTFYIIVG